MVTQDRSSAFISFDSPAVKYKMKTIPQAEEPMANCNLERINSR
jgi:hypothetical protein